MSRSQARGWKRFLAGAGLCLASIIAWGLCAEVIFRIARIDVATQFRMSKVHRPERRLSLPADPWLWVHPIDEHPNEIAHRIAAQAMADYLLAHAREMELYRPHALQPAAPAR